MKIRVTRKHIAKGVPDDNDRCPVAKAFRAKGFSTVTTRLFMDHMNYPQSTSRFIDRFDAGEKVKPFTFTI